ncbi:MAG: hypothetical protein ACR652_17465 [Methylocystis sp.]|uniref:hypothetical protein n=1 Tax=Methylocystis sp. TaxID=1911079 RepID=UPI003DA4A5C9
MIDNHINLLRQRMIDDMTVRHFKEKAQKDYIRHVRNFTVFLGRLVASFCFDLGGPSRINHSCSRQDMSGPPYRASL